MLYLRGALIKNGVRVGTRARSVSLVPARGLSRLGVRAYLAKGDGVLAITSLLADALDARDQERDVVLDSSGSLGPATGCGGGGV